MFSYRPRLQAQDRLNVYFPKWKLHPDRRITLPVRRPADHRLKFARRVLKVPMSCTRARPRRRNPLKAYRDSLGRRCARPATKSCVRSTRRVPVKRGGRSRPRTPATSTRYFVAPLRRTLRHCGRQQRLASTLLRTRSFRRVP